MKLDLSSSDSLDQSSTSSMDPLLVTSMVPFQWEEAPGKPRTAPTTPSGNEMIPNQHRFTLQLPPKLQFQGHPSPLSLPQSPYQIPSPLHHHHHHLLHQSSPLSLSRVPPITHQKLKSLYKYMHRPASGNHPPPTQSWGGGSYLQSPSFQHKLTTINDRFFFDEASPRAFKYGASMDAWKTHLNPHLEDHKSNGEHKTLSFLAMEDHEAVSNASSPWHPIQFRDGEDSVSPYQSASIKSSEESGQDIDEEHASFHDFSSKISSSSSEKASDIADEGFEITCGTESACPSSTWVLDFSPEEEAIREDKRGSIKLVTRFVALIKLKNIISSKASKLRRRREEANDQEAYYTSIWSPTLATYLYHNELREDRESSRPSLHHLPSEEEEEDDGDGDGDAQLQQSYSVASSHGFHINPDYHLPGSVLRGHLQVRKDFLEGDDSSSFRVHGLGESGRPFSGEEEEEDESHKLTTHRLSLREHLAEFGDEYPFQPAAPDQSGPPRMLIESNQREPAPRKGMRKARKTVEVLVATIKLILVNDDGKRHGRRPSFKYGNCLKPTLSTISPFPSTHR